MSAVEAGGCGRRRRGAGRQRDSPSASRAHFGEHTRAHTVTSTQALPPTRSCPRAHSHSTDPDALAPSPGKLRARTRKRASAWRHREPTVRTAQCSPTPPAPLLPGARTEPTAPTPWLSPSFPPESQDPSTRLVAMATPARSPGPRSILPPLPRRGAGAGGGGRPAVRSRIRRGGACGTGPGEPQRPFRDARLGGVIRLRAQPGIWSPRAQRGISGQGRRRRAAAGAFPRLRPLAVQVSPLVTRSSPEGGRPFRREGVPFGNAPPSPTLHPLQASPVPRPSGGAEGHGLLRARALQPFPSRLPFSPATCPPHCSL